MDQNKFILSIETSHNKYNACKIHDGLIKLIDDPNVEPTVFEIERVRYPNRGFKLKGNGVYYRRYQQGMLIPAEGVEPDIFLYDFETKILKVWSKNQQFICIFNSRILVAYPIIELLWKELPCCHIGSFDFYFEVFEGERLQRGTHLLYLVPSTLRGNWFDIKRSGNIGKETFTFTIDKKKFTTEERRDDQGNITHVRSESIVHLEYVIDESKIPLEMTNTIERSRKFLIKNNMVYTKLNDRYVPLLAGEQDDKGYLVTIPNSFINFHPL